jgi:DNA repair ATPase RecN
MPEIARPISLRLAPHHIEALKARAHTGSGTLTGVARELILTGLAGADNKALGERLMQIERRLAALEGLARDVSDTARHIVSVTGELRAKFDALLNALSSAEAAV